MHARYEAGVALFDYDRGAPLGLNESPLPSAAFVASGRGVGFGL